VTSIVKYEVYIALLIKSFWEAITSKNDVEIETIKRDLINIIGKYQAELKAAMQLTTQDFDEVRF